MSEVGAAASTAHPLQQLRAVQEECSRIPKGRANMTQVSLWGRAGQGYCRP